MRKPTDNGFSQDEINLLELLSTINKLETQCRRLNTSWAVPAIVYSLLGKLRDQVAKWGTEAIARGRDE